MSKIKPTSTHDENKRKLEAECPEIYAANLISGQWTVAICCYLAAGKLRYADLKKRMPSISPPTVLWNLTPSSTPTRSRFVSVVGLFANVQRLLVEGSATLT